MPARKRLEVGCAVTDIGRMKSFVEIYSGGFWQQAALFESSNGLIAFDYLPEYVFGGEPTSIALNLPVKLELLTAKVGQAETPLAFFWDLVPQGPGRQYLAGLLGFSGESASHDFPLGQHGAYASIGRTRLSTAVAFYQQQALHSVADALTDQKMLSSPQEVLQQLNSWGMLSAGTPCVQGVAPKFLLTQDREGNWHPDASLKDAAAQRHWILKLARGPHADDQKLLRHEEIYLRTAAACGLRAIEDPKFVNGMLFIPRFDRQVTGYGVDRLHQETLASILGRAGFGATVSLFDVVIALATHATDPGAAVGEFICRDVFNRALNNRDNHLRNTSVQVLQNGVVQLTPMYDVSPMYLDREGISRTNNWTLPDVGQTNNWDQIIDNLELEDVVKSRAVAMLKCFASEHLPRLPELLAFYGADQDVIEVCKPYIQAQCLMLARI